MQPNLVLLPNKQFIQKVFNLRKQIVENKLGKSDPRDKVLPHTTVLYFEENLTDKKVDECMHQLNNLQISKPIILDIIEVTNWEHKVVARFNASPLDSLKSKVGKLISNTKIRFNTEYKKVYGDTIGDHMKLARQINVNKIEETKKLFKKTLPKNIQFERIAFIGYEGEEKDILWQKQLDFE